MFMLTVGSPLAWIGGTFALKEALGIEFLLAFVLALNGLVCFLTLFIAGILFYDYWENNNKVDSLKMAWILVPWTPVSIAGYFLFQGLNDKGQIFNLLVGTSVSYVCFVFMMCVISKCIWLIKANEIQARGNVVVPPMQPNVIIDTHLPSVSLSHDQHPNAALAYQLVWTAGYIVKTVPPESSDITV